MTTRVFFFRKVLAPSRCYMAEWGDTAKARILYHGCDHANANDRVRGVVQNANAHANCRLISLASVFSVCLRNIVVDDPASANGSERGRGHDGCGSWPKLAEHRMKPYFVWPAMAVLDRALKPDFVLPTSLMCFFAVVACFCADWIGSFVTGDLEYAIVRSDKRSP